MMSATAFAHEFDQRFTLARRETIIREIKAHPDVPICEVLDCLPADVGDVTIGELAGGDLERQVLSESSVLSVLRGALAVGRDEVSAGYISVRMGSPKRWTLRRMMQVLENAGLVARSGVTGMTRYSLTDDGRGEF